jgi:hypothetical protein
VSAFRVGGGAPESVDLHTAIDSIVRFPFGLRVVVSPDVEDRAPMLLDTSIVGRLYLGGLQAASDPYTGFSRNTTQLRSEFLTLCVIRNADGVFIADPAARSDCPRSPEATCCTSPGRPSQGVQHERQPGNCRWATPLEQRHNRRDSVAAA